MEDLAPEIQATMAGKKPIVIAQLMVKDLDLSVSPEVFLSRKTDIFMASVVTDLQSMPGLNEAVDGLRTAGYPQGIGTSGSAEYTNLVLDRFGIREYFSAIVTGEEITHGKPNPETYLKVAEKLGVNSTRSVVIEDATTGIASAKAAGSYCIALANPNAVEQDLSRADKIIFSLSEVNPRTIEEFSVRVK